MIGGLKEARLQKLVPTARPVHKVSGNRNHIGGWARSVRQHTMSKRVGNNPDLVDVAAISGKRMFLPGEILA